MFALNHDLARFKEHLRDFLCQLKEFGGNNEDLYAEEREQLQESTKAAERERAKKVSGLLKPSELEQDDEL